MDVLAIDETVREPSKKMKVVVFFTVTYSLCFQIEDRFPEKSLALICQMIYFPHEGSFEVAFKYA